MKTVSRSQLWLLLLLLAASIVTAKEKLLVVVQKSNSVSSSEALDLAEKIGKLSSAQAKYEITATDELTKLYVNEKEYAKTENAINNDLSKLANKVKADKVLAILLLEKQDKSILASARMIDVQNDNTVAFNNFNYFYSFSEFTKTGIDGLVEPVISEKANKIPEGSLSVTSNEPIKVYVDKKRVKDSFLANLALSEGHHEIFLQKEDGYIIDKKNVYFSGDNKIAYNYTYTAKGNAIVKSLILPGWGQFSTDRKLSGSLYSAAAVGGVALLGYGVMSYNQSKSDYDDAKHNSETAALYQDRLAYATQANGFRDDCSSANSLVFAGVAVLAASYMASALDIYFSSSEHKLDVSGNDSFSSNLHFSGNTLAYNFPVNTNRETHNPNNK